MHECKHIEAKTCPCVKYRKKIQNFFNKRHTFVACLKQNVKCDVCNIKNYRNALSRHISSFCKQ